ncbi:hypothetical protein ACTXT7_005899 [Hymenolepis weldensis]
MSSWRIHHRSSKLNLLKPKYLSNGQACRLADLKGPFSIMEFRAVQKLHAKA